MKQTSIIKVAGEAVWEEGVLPELVSALLSVPQMYVEGDYLTT